MTDEAEALGRLNVEIGEAEARGDRAFLGDRLASAFAMRRADGVTIVDRAQFLAAVAPSGGRDTTIESVEIRSNRAVVRCVVELTTPDGRRRFDNIRLFTRSRPSEPWLLLAWANEPAQEA